MKAGQVRQRIKRKKKKKLNRRKKGQVFVILITNWEPLKMKKTKVNLIKSSKKGMKLVNKNV